MDFEAEWARCSPWIEAALEWAGPTHLIEDVKAAIEAGEAGFWPFPNCAAVTELHTWPRMRSLNVWLAGGDLTELVETALPNVETFARDQGCRMIVIPGRKGWSRALGYKPACYSCTKELI
jgi:hypothetical protein